MKTKNLTGKHEGMKTGKGMRVRNSTHQIFHVFLISCLPV